MEEIEKILNFQFGAIALSDLLWTLVLMVVCLLIGKLLIGILSRAIRRGKLDASVKNALCNVVRFVVYFLVILVIADRIGIPITSLVAALSIAGLAVSLAIQDTLSNVFSGVILLVSKPFLSGDYIALNGLEGTVVSVNLMNTELLTPDHKNIFIPNKDVNTSAITNYSRSPLRRVELRVSASYDDATDKVKSALQKAIVHTPYIEADPAPFIALSAYQGSSIEYLVRVWVTNARFWDVHFALNESVREAFSEDGITMTYDHLNVHMIDE